MQQESKPQESVPDESWLSRFVRLRLYHMGLRVTERFNKAARTPEETQWRVLEKILVRERDTAFGRDHHFREIRNVEDFRKRVPVGDYEYIRPYIDRVVAGETSALFHKQKVLMFALTSGTTSARKMIPVTKHSLNAYRQGWVQWGLHTFVKYPPLLFGAKVTLTSDADEFRTDQGIPCGSMSGLTTQMQNPIIRGTYCLPPAAARIHNTATKYYQTWRMSLQRDVGMWVSPNPSTHIALARFGDDHKEQLIRDVADGTCCEEFAVDPSITKKRKRWLKPNPDRARELEQIVDATGHLRPKDVWPSLGMIGCWLGGTVGSYLRFFPEYFGDIPVRDVGLIASESRMTVPIEDHTAAGPLDINGSFFEFIPSDQMEADSPDVLQSHELQPGCEYAILLTTASGLYRYNIRDVVRCDGFHERTPIITFLHKGSGISNLTGEKLTEYQVVQSVTAAESTANLRLGTYSLAPLWEGEIPHYTLYVETAALAKLNSTDDWAELVEKNLQAANIEYAAKRDSGRLGCVQVERVPDGFWADWDRQRLQTGGGTAEQYKHPYLITNLDTAADLPAHCVTATR